MNEYNYQYDGFDEYCYPETKVLINKLNLMNPQELHETEREITFLRLTQLQRNPIRGKYGFSHLKSIYRYLFSDIYNWAGKIRQGSFLSKGDTIFCKGEFIEQDAARIFAELSVEKITKPL
jgi:Protein involved in cell division